MAYKDPEKQREYQRQWMAKRRAEFFKGKACIDCGATENLELDHQSSAEKIDHKVWSWSQARRDGEVAKCDVRCRDCHTKRHQRLTIQHGTKKRYEAGCRCNLCRWAASERGYRKRKAAA